MRSAGLERRRPRNRVYLRARFYALWERLGAKGDPEQVFDDLIRQIQSIAQGQVVRVKDPEL